MHGQAQYKCSACNKEFTSKGGLKYHEDGNVCSAKALPEEANFSCSVCNREFTSKGGLKYHKDHVCSATGSSLASIGKLSSRPTSIASSVASALSSARAGEELGVDLPALAGPMTCFPSSLDKEKVCVAGRDFSKGAFSDWAIRSVDDLANKYSNDGAIPSTIGPHGSR